MKKMSNRAITSICVLFVIITGVVFLSYSGGIFVTDRSAKVNFENMTWNGKNYLRVSGEYTEGKTIAKSEDGNWNINEVEEDASHTFVVARAFLDQFLFVDEEYDIPTSGKITKAYWNGNYITDKEFLDSVSEIEDQKDTSFEYETEGIFRLTDTQEMKILYFAYNDCPITTQYKGYMGKVNGNWVITTYISSDQNYKNGVPKPHSVGCYAIPDKYWAILEKYFL